MLYSNNEQRITNNDVVIAGGGLAGLSQALALSFHGIPSLLIEKSTHSLHQQPGYDGRTSFVTLGNHLLYQQWGAWERMATYAEPVKDIRILDGDSPLFLHYDHRDTGTQAMGYIIENTHFRRALIEAVQAQPLITVRENTIVEKATPDSHYIHLQLPASETLKAKLLIVADGKNSALRDAAGINTRRQDYRQTAIICAVSHPKHHESVAIERFLPAGPFAILPMPGGHHSSLVWTERADLAENYLALDDADFTAAITARFGSYLGPLTLASPRWKYPLDLTYATRLYADRLALIGDSAHAIHPIAGQGFNLSMKDIAALADLIAAQKSVGLDIGTDDVLAAYARQRTLDNLQMIAATDGLNRLFSNNLTTARIVRRIGLGLVEKLPGVKKRFMRHAMAVTKTA